MSPIAHSGIGLLGWELAASRKNIKTLLLFILVANLADIDFLFHTIFGVRRLFIHQYYTHNLAFVTVAAALLSLSLPAGRDRWGLVLTGLSHLAVDIIVVDPIRPIGIRLFYPFSKRLFNWGLFPYLKRGSFQVMLSSKNLYVLILEAAIFIAPVIFCYRKQLFSLVKDREFWTI